MTLAATDTIEAIRAALSGGIERDAAAYAIDGQTPAAAFEPASREELASILRLAAEGGLAVSPQGERTAIEFGRPLDAYDLAIDTRGLRRTIEYVPDDLTVTVEAGRRLAGLQAELAEQGQYLSIDPPPGDDVTIGGLLATARPGAWRGHLPAARDLILGMRVATPDGEILSSGGRVVKNVTGYDLQRLHTGALGAFGVIVEATFKVAPLPAATRTLSTTAPTLAAATATAMRIWDASPALRALSVLTPEAARMLGLPAEPTILAELFGTLPAVDRSTRDLRSAVPLADGPTEVWPTLRSQHGALSTAAGAATDAGAAIVRAGVPPTSIAAVLEEMTAHGATAWAHIASGAVVGRFDGAEASTILAVRAAAEARGGFLVVESGPAILRARLDPATGDATLVRALRDRFDLRRTINRGRWGASL